MSHLERARPGDATTGVRCIEGAISLGNTVDPELTADIDAAVRENQRRASGNVHDARIIQSGGTEAENAAASGDASAVTILTFNRSFASLVA